MSDYFIYLKNIVELYIVDISITYLFPKFQTRLQRLIEGGGGPPQKRWLTHVPLGEKESDFIFDISSKKKLVEWKFSRELIFDGWVPSICLFLGSNAFVTYSNVRPSTVGSMSNYCSVLPLRITSPFLDCAQKKEMTLFSIMPCLFIFCQWLIFARFTYAKQNLKEDFTGSTD